MFETFLLMTVIKLEETALLHTLSTFLLNVEIKLCDNGCSYQVRATLMLSLVLDSHAISCYEFSRVWTHLSQHNTQQVRAYFSFPLFCSIAS